MKHFYIIMITSLMFNLFKKLGKQSDEFLISLNKWQEQKLNLNVKSSEDWLHNNNI